jgi:AcrR family transcriptional regulator
MGAEAKSARTPSPASMYRKLTPRGAGLTPQEIVSNQRARMYAAMIETVAERGYAATSIRRLRILASVSPDAIYREFRNKERYFLATYDVIVARAVKNVNTAFLGERDQTRQLQTGFAAFAQEVVQQPNAARLALVEALGAGPAVLVRMERASEAFERLIQSSFERAPDGVTLPSLVARGIVGGIARVTRQLLIEHREQELPDLADDFVRWALAYRCEGAGLLPPAPVAREREERPTPYGRFGEKDRRELLLHRVARVAVERGYANVTVDAIVRATRPLGNTFVECYPKGTDRVERCFLDAYDLMGSEVARVTADAALAGADWIDSVRCGITAVMRRVGEDPTFARIAFIEVFSVGPAGIDRRSRLMDRFTALLMSRVPAEERPSEIIAEAIVGAVWQVAHHYIARQATHQLLELTDHASYLVLAPIIGGDAAMERVLAAR